MSDTQSAEITQPENIGATILRILELGPMTRKIELEAECPTLIVTVTTTGYIHSDDTGSSLLLDMLKHYKLVPLTPAEFDADGSKP